MPLRTCRRLSYILYGVSCALALVGIFLKNGNSTLSLWMVGAGLLVFAAAFLVGIIFYRCPLCKRLLPIKERDIEVCPHCKGKLKKSNG
ncbi:MAG: hypothetical protein LBM28_00860 [Oscillospiraceae bacterium]|jgi:hypothetical protein|nr:hypothetical protein [Oscillospiraceae bacterium]